MNNMQFTVKNLVLELLVCLFFSSWMCEFGQAYLCNGWQLKSVTFWNYETLELTSHSSIALWLCPLPTLHKEWIVQPYLSHIATVHLCSILKLGYESCILKKVWLKLILIFMTILLVQLNHERLDSGIFTPVLLTNFIIQLVLISNIHHQRNCNVISFYLGYRFRSMFRPSFRPFIP